MDKKDLSPSPQNQTEPIRKKVAAFAMENRRALQVTGAVTGVVAAAGISGAVGGVLAFKGITASKGAAAAKAALIAKGSTAAKAATSSLPAILAPQGILVPQGTGTLGAIAARPAIASAIIGKTSGLVGTLSGNALPLAAVLAGGGVIGTTLIRGRAF